jgi:hypothetical protein
MSVLRDYLKCVKASEDGLTAIFVSDYPADGLKFSEIHDYDHQVVIGEADSSDPSLDGYGALLVFNDTVANYIGDDADCADVDDD